MQILQVELIIYFMWPYCHCLWWSCSPVTHTCKVIQGNLEYRIIRNTGANSTKEELGEPKLQEHILVLLLDCHSKFDTFIYYSLDSSMQWTKLYNFKL